MLVVEERVDGIADEERKQNTAQVLECDLQRAKRRVNRLLHTVEVRGKTWGAPVLPTLARPQATSDENLDLG